jgi:hypothetical protein
MMLRHSYLQKYIKVINFITDTKKAPYGHLALSASPLSGPATVYLKGIILSAIGLEG